MKIFFFFQLVILSQFCNSSGNNSDITSPLDSPVQSKSVATKGILVPGESTLLVFTSGKNETGRQNVLLRFSQQGDYSLIFENTNPRYSDHWIIWDCIRLKDEDFIIWSLGEMEAPPNYSKAAFNEFCDKGECQNDYTVGKSSNNMFSKELNDHDVTKAMVNFSIDSKNVNKELILEISTLFSTHPGVDGFNMRVSLK